VSRFDPAVDVVNALVVARNRVSLCETDHILSIAAENAAIDLVDVSWGPDKVRAHEALLKAMIVRHECCNAVRAAEDEVLRLERWQRIISAVTSVPLHRSVTVQSVGRTA
jgi:hypothetical protein